MKLTQRLTAALMATSVSLLGLAYVPLAHAHACNGPGTIKIVAKKRADGSVEYWYFQNGKVCGRFVA